MAAAELLAFVSVIERRFVDPINGLSQASWHWIEAMDLPQRWPFGSPGGSLVARVYNAEAKTC